LYFRFCLSFRDVEELLSERGIKVTYEAIRKWCHKICGGRWIKTARCWISWCNVDATSRWRRSSSANS
jgi:transposase-like protein